MGWLKYWKNTLADADRKKINVNTYDVIKVDNYFINKVPDIRKEILWKDANVKKEVKTIAVDICPCKASFDFEHAKQDRKESQVVYPFWLPARIDRQGNLYPSEENPFFVREYLTPNPSNYYRVASIGKVDKDLGKMSFVTKDWKEYWDNCELFFKEVTGKDFEEFNTALEKEIYVKNGTKRNLTSNIRNLYHKIIEIKPQNSLFNKFIGNETALSISIPTEHEIQTNKNHLGQMKGDFPLSKTQRESICAFTKLENGDVLAVNGPPGTGKTTLLQSVVANLVVESVIKKQPPYLLMASSTNNQAITNILDSFKEKEEKCNNFSSRWLPDLDSFGLYFSSSKYSKYSKFESPIGNGFMKNYENKDYEGLRDFYLGKFSLEYESNKSIEGCKQFLFDKLNSTVADIHDHLQSAIALENLLVKALDVDALTKAIDLIAKKRIDLESEHKKLITSEEKLNGANKRIGFLDKLLFFLPIVKERRASLFQKALLSLTIGEVLDWSDYSNLLHIINKKFIKIDRYLKRICKEEDTLKRKRGDINKEFKETQNEYNKKIKEWDEKYRNKLEGLYESTGKEYQNLSCSEDMNVRLDISLRSASFWLAIHYREAVYLELLKEKLERDRLYNKPAKERGEKSYNEKLQRMACLFPLFIATFHSLPKYATFYKHEAGEFPYFELFDYLIVDEAGQVAPDIAIPSFSLAKKAIVVGDVLQIEPIWSVNKDIDRVNLIKNGLIEKDISEEKFLEIEKKGILCASGNLMHIAKKASRYEGGVLLREHRRCLDSIISYSNNYVYSNQLELKVGSNHTQKHVLPPKGYLHISGQSIKVGTSRKNDLEATIIAKWIHVKCEELEEDYHKEIHDIIAVVTPYERQEKSVKNKLKKLDKKYEKIIIGTVNKLQGAAKEIIIFSLVVSKNDSLAFLNRYNMLNVAVSRAKHSFLVFGNINILKSEENSPLGNLKKWMLEEKNVELPNDIVYQDRFLYNEKVKRISDLKGHVDALKRAIEIAKKELIIVSPFISSNAILHDGLVEMIQKRVSEGVKIVIITDSQLDVFNGILKKKSLEGRNLLMESGAVLKIVNGIHSKTIIIDDDILIEGSFNWLSALRNADSNYSRHETSIVLQNKAAKKQVLKAKKELEMLVLSK